VQQKKRGVVGVQIFEFICYFLKKLFQPKDIGEVVKQDVKGFFVMKNKIIQNVDMKNKNDRFFENTVREPFYDASVLCTACGDVMHRHF
jgi:hypothetical protein